MRWVVVAVAFLLAVPGAARAQEYGGGGTPSERQSGLGISVKREGSVITVRVAGGFRCRRVNFPNTAVRIRGTISGESFTATGTTRIHRRLRLRATVSGTFAGDSAAGQSSVRFIRGRGGPRGCVGRSNIPFRVRTASAPAGAPAAPAAGTLMHGLTSELAGPVHLPVTLRILSDGRLLARWSSVARCARGRVPLENLTPPTRVNADGTFSRPERFSIRYDDGTTERYRISFSGRFLSDGATGSLRVRVNLVARGTVLARCDSGAQTFAAAP